MNKGEVAVAVGLMLLTLTATHGIWRAVVPYEQATATPHHEVHLPSLCHHHYNNGTDQWIECMGVGYK